MRTRQTLPHRATRLLGVALTLAFSATLLAAVPASASPANQLIYGAVDRNGVRDVGATVNVDFWPNTDVLAALPEGAEVSLWTTTGTTNAEGTFDIAVDPSTLPAEYLSPEGTADITVTTTSTVGDSGSWNLTVSKPDPSAGQVQWYDAEYGEPSKVTFEMGTTPTVLNYNAVGSDVVDELDNETTSDGIQPLTVSRAASGVPMGSVSPAGVICPILAGRWFYGVPEKWLRAISYSKAPMTIDEQVGSDHSLGIGFSLSGGPWSQSGMATISVKNSAGGTRGGLWDVYVYNKVNYRDFYTACGGRWRRPQSFYDLIAEDYLFAARHLYYTVCVTKSSGTYWKSAGSNATYSGGVNVGGVGLDVHSSFMVDNRIAWTFKATSRLCGSSSVGWPTSPRAGVNPP